MAAKKVSQQTTDSLPLDDSASLKPAAKKAAKAAKKTPAKKAAAKSAKPAAATAAPAETPAPPATAPSAEAIAHAAYLNYRSRVEQGMHGDSEGDWLDAERRAKAGE